MPLPNPVFFVSYARSDIQHPAFREHLTTFISDLEARVAQDLGRPPEGVAFVDTNDVHAGEQWSPELASALERCAVGLPLFTASYFARSWCGKEFRVFLDRSRAGGGPSGIVPVRWGSRLPTLPECAARIQYTDNAFPAEYADIGLQKLLELKSVLPGKYELALHAIASRIFQAATESPLASIGSIDLDVTVSSWDAETGGDPWSHTKGSISKTCFVYIAREGWAWRPYQGNSGSIGAMAQQISGELNLQYEEISPDSSMVSKLLEANASDVPIVLFGDPGSFSDDRFEQPMRQYDTQYLLNCATLVAWDSQTKNSIATDPRWARLAGLCRQKVLEPPPHHDWRSIFSRDDLEQKTKVAIESMRSRLMKQLIVDPDLSGGAPVRRAVDAVAAASAAAKGIPTDTLAQLANSSS